ASILETAPGTEYKLILKSNTKGAEGIDYIDAGAGTLLGLSVAVEGADAVVVVDGIEVKRKSNYMARRFKRDKKKKSFFKKLQRDFAKSAFKIFDHTLVQFFSD
ncbi:MAG: hypothetical protein LOD92_05575, partial [Bacillales bacterium]